MTDWGLKELYLLSFDFAEQHVGEAAGAEAEPLVCKPFLAQHLLNYGVIDEGVHNAVDATCRLETDLDASLVVLLLDGLTHHVGSLRCGSRLQFACGCLDIVSAGIHGED